MFVKSLIFSGFFLCCRVDIRAGPRPYMPPGQFHFPVPLWSRGAARRRRRCAADAAGGRRARPARTEAVGTTGDPQAAGRRCPSGARAERERRGSGGTAAARRPKRSAAVWACIGRGPTPRKGVKRHPPPRVAARGTRETWRPQRPPAPQGAQRAHDLCDAHAPSVVWPNVRGGPVAYP